MDVSLEELKELSPEDIYQKLSNFFDNIFKINNKHGMNYSEFKKIILDEIETSKEEYTGSIDYNIYIKKNVLKRLKTNTDYLYTNCIKNYIKDIDSIKPYDKSIEEELIKKAQNGDIEARNMIMENYLKLVISIVKRYLDKGLSFEDLIQEGNLGLIKAINNYDKEKGTKFSTYSVWWIRQTVGRAIADKGKTIRIPVYIYEKLSLYKRTFATLEKELGRIPKDDEIMERMNISKEMFSQLDKLNQKTESLNEKIYEDEDTELAEIIANSDIPVETKAIITTEKDDINLLLTSNGLSEREITILTLRYGLDGNDPITLEEIGNMYGLTRERIRQVESKALNKLRASNMIYNYIDYMDSPANAFKNIKRMNSSLNNNKRENKSHIKEELYYDETTGTIEKRKIQTIYSIFFDFSTVKVDNAISKLSQLDQFLIKLRYGGDLEEPRIFEITDNQKKYFDEVIVPNIRERLLSFKYNIDKESINSDSVFSKSFTINDCIKLHKMLDKYINSGISYYLSINQFFIKVLSEGYINDKNFSKEDILNILHITDQEYDMSLLDENRIISNKEDEMNINKILKRIKTLYK